MKSMIRWGSIGLSWIGKATIAVMMFLITACVFMRYVIHKPIYGSNDLVMAMMVVIIMVGLAYTEVEEGHVAVTLLVDKLSPRVKAAIGAFNTILMLGILLLLAWKSLDYAFFSLRIMDSSDAIEIPFYPFKFVMFAGFLFWALETFLKLLSTLSKLKKKE